MIFNYNDYTHTLNFLPKIKIFEYLLSIKKLDINILFFSRAVQIILCLYVLTVGILYWTIPDDLNIVVEDRGESRNNGSVGFCRSHVWHFGMVSTGNGFFHDKEDLGDLDLNKFYMVENCPKLLILVLFDSKSKKFIDVVQVKNLSPFSKRIRYVMIDYVTYWYNKDGPLQQYLKKK